MAAFAFGGNSARGLAEIVYQATSPECAEEHLSVLREIFSDSPLFNLEPTNAEAFTAGDLIIVSGTLKDFDLLITELVMGSEGERRNA